MMITSGQLQKIIANLHQRQFFKLIAGGSFSDVGRLQQLITAYGTAGIDMIDVSASLPVVEAAIEALNALDMPPALMVSFPLDADPHFRKIELLEDACIACGACLPVCPTQVFGWEMAANLPLTVDTPLCYGCGRCVPICPTDALKLDPFSVYPDLTRVLAMPQVAAVEIHSAHADPAMIEALYAELGPLLQNKLISLCLRPQTLPLEDVLECVLKLKHQTPYPLIVQVDGIPMSGSDDPHASLPALDAAREFAPYLPQDCFLTVSGGINDKTAEYLLTPDYQVIQGVGMGTFARQWVWNHLEKPDPARVQAHALIRYFKNPATSAIMTTSP